MLKGISPLVSPELLSALSRMGHGDELVLGAAHFPAETFGKAGGAVVLRADGIPAAALMDAILPLFELDSYGTDAPMITMEAVPGDELDPDVEGSRAQHSHKLRIRHKVAARSRGKVTAPPFAAFNAKEPVCVKQSSTRLPFARR